MKGLSSEFVSIQEYAQRAPYLLISLYSSFIDHALCEVNLFLFVYTVNSCDISVFET